MPFDAPPWSVTPRGLSVAVRLTPKGGRDAVDGIERLADGRSVIKARVRAAASEGQANKALRGLIAKTLAVPPRDVTLEAGATSRVKRLAVAGDPVKLTAILERIA